MGARRWGSIVLSAVVLAANLMTPAQASEEAPASDCKISPTGNVQLTAGFPTAPHDPSANGSLSAVALFVKFADTPQDLDIAPEMEHVFAPAVERFSAYSRGRFVLDIEPFQRWLELPGPSTEYNNDTEEALRELVGAAAQAAVAAGKDLSPYRLVYVVPTMLQTTMNASTAFIAPPGYGITVPGKEITEAVAFGSDRLAVGGHNITLTKTANVIGLPPLGEHVGSWDPTSGATVDSELMAWMRWKLGWLDDDRVVCVTTQKDTWAWVRRNGAPKGFQAIVVKINSHTAYVAEARRQTGYDRDQCADGLLVYKVDADVGVLGGPIRVQVAERMPESVECGDGVIRDYAYAPYRLGADHVAEFTDVAAGVGISVIEEHRDGATLVRVTRTCE